MSVQHRTTHKSLGSRHLGDDDGSYLPKVHLSLNLLNGTALHLLLKHIDMCLLEVPSTDSAIEEHVKLGESPSSWLSSRLAFFLFCRHVTGRYELGRGKLTSGTLK